MQTVLSSLHLRRISSILQCFKDIVVWKNGQAMPTLGLNPNPNADLNIWSTKQTQIHTIHSPTPFPRTFFSPDSWAVSCHFSSLPSLIPFCPLSQSPGLLIPPPHQSPDPRRFPHILFPSSILDSYRLFPPLPNKSNTVIHQWRMEIVEGRGRGKKTYAVEKNTVSYGALADKLWGKKGFVGTAVAAFWQQRPDSVIWNERWAGLLWLLIYHRYLRSSRT